LPWLLPLTLHPWAEQLQAKHTQVETDITHKTTNNGLQRRDKTLHKISDSMTGDTVGQEDLQGHKGPQHRASMAAPEKQS